MRDTRCKCSNSRLYIHAGNVVLTCAACSHSYVPANTSRSFLLQKAQDITQLLQMQVNSNNDAYFDNVQSWLRSYTPHL